MMNIKRGYLVRVIADYQAPFPDPIKVRQGDVVAIDVHKKTDVTGWVWCTNDSGKSGWVPESYVDIQGTTGKMVCDYDAVELTVRAGAILTVHKEESDFYWVTNEHGKQGWVPVSHLEPYEDRESLTENREAR